MAKFFRKGFFGDDKTRGEKNKDNLYLRARFGDNSTPSGWGFDDVDRTKLAELITSPTKGNGVVYSITNSIAETAAELFKYVELLDDKGEVVESSPILDLIRKPNDLDTQSSLIKQIVMNLLAVGDAFVYGENNVAKGTRTALYVVPSAEVTIEQGSVTNPIKGYKYANKKDLLKTDNTLFIRLASISSSSVYGQSPIVSVYKDVEVLDTAKRLQAKLLKEGGVRNIICVKQIPDGNNFEAFKDVVSQRLNDKSSKTNEVFVYPLERIPMGDSAADLALTEIIKTKTEAICNAFGYPTNLFYRDSTFSNLSEAKKEKYTITIPILNLVLEALTSFIVPKDTGLKLVLNTDKIEELRPDHTKVIESMRDYATINEVRQFLGLPAVDGGDVLLVAIGKMPLADIVEEGSNSINENQ